MSPSLQNQTRPPAKPALRRFTLDGSDALEARLEGVCQRVLEGVRELVPDRALETLVLGGGYGRGQGGVLKSPGGDEPYNDLEFYVFIRGNVLLHERRYRQPLEQLGDRLAPDAGLHVEFKVYSREKLRQSPVSMYSYDLVAGHRLVHGNAETFRGCEHHLDAGQIPLHEATRLLFNRCSGLLIAADYLRREPMSAEQTRFVERNLAKAQLALGDALLAAFGRYHWSCLERRDLLAALRPDETLPWLADIQRHHAIGVDFKLHPRHDVLDRGELRRLHTEIINLARRLWLWLESRRLRQSFASPRDYALAPVRKLPDAPPGRNALLNLRTFGPVALANPNLFRYPRERLFNALCLLLWEEQALADAAARRCLQASLQVKQPRWPDLLAAYQALWRNYG